MANAILLNQSTEVTGNNILGALAHDLLIDVDLNTNTTSDPQLIFQTLTEEGEVTSTPVIHLNGLSNWANNLGFATKTGDVQPLSKSLSDLTGTVNGINTRVGSLENNKLNTSVYTSDKTQIDSQIQAINGSINTLNSNMITLDNNLSYEQVQG